MKIEIKANGKTIQTEINEEQAKILGLTIDKPKTGYERVEKSKCFNPVVIAAAFFSVVFFLRWEIWRYLHGDRKSVV